MGLSLHRKWSNILRNGMLSRYGIDICIVLSYLHILYLCKEYLNPMPHPSQAVWKERIRVCSEVTRSCTLFDRLQMLYKIFVCLIMYPIPSMCMVYLPSTFHVGKYTYQSHGWAMGIVVKTSEICCTFFQEQDPPKSPSLCHPGRSIQAYSRHPNLSITISWAMWTLEV